MSNSTTRREIRLIEAVDDSQCKPESVTTYVWRHPEKCIPSTTAREHTEAVFAKEHTWRPTQEMTISSDPACQN